MNKLKAKILKMYASLKEYFKDQTFYTKEALDDLKNLTYKFSRFLVFACLIIVLSLSSKFLHMAYIESHVGGNSIYVRSPEGARLQGSGSAFEVQAPSGKVYTITNAHVCGLQKDGFLMAYEKRKAHRLVPLRILEVYEKNDLCILEGLAGYEGLQLADSIEVSQSAWALGYPMGQALDISSGRVKSFGTVDVIDEETPIDQCNKPGHRIIKGQMLIFEFQFCVVTRNSALTDVRIFPGNSGSPLVNVYGNVIGVVFAADNTTNWGVAVPLNDLKAFLNAY